MTEPFDEEPHGVASKPFFGAARCGARNRQQKPCGAAAMRNGRCRFHGGLSTGPRTAEGIERIRKASRNYTRGRIEKTKTDQIRRVDLSDALLHELDSLKKRRKAEYLHRGKNEIPEWVFLGPGQVIWEDGKPIGREEGQQLEMHNVKNRFFHKCLEKAGLRRIRFHDLRHTFASLLIQNGESLAYVKDQLGHSSIKMTWMFMGIWCLERIERR
jgi:hypothetical protein